MTPRNFDKRSGLAFIVAFGIVSLFADAAYEGMRGITGPYLALLGASGTAVGIIAGTGELFGYVLRLGSGRLAERSGAYWAVTLVGYVVQMAAVPALALAGSWWIAAALIVIERTGKAIRNPAANFMMSRAGAKIGQGWAFGLHEVLDQAGAMAGPLIAALVLAEHGRYTQAFLWLGIPAALTLISIAALRLHFPYAGEIARARAGERAGGLSRAFWLYAACAALIAFGFADWPLIAYRFAQVHVVSKPMVPILYAAAMAAAGLSALALGRLFDRRGFVALLPGIFIAAAAAPLAFLGGSTLAIAGAIAWGAALGMENSVLTAGVAHLVGESARARAYGIFSAAFGMSWFLGSALLGALYDISIPLLVAVSIAAELAALIPLALATRLTKA